MEKLLQAMKNTVPVARDSDLFDFLSHKCTELRLLHTMGQFHYGLMKGASTWDPLRQLSPNVATAFNLCNGDNGTASVDAKSTASGLKGPKGKKLDSTSAITGRRLKSLEVDESRKESETSLQRIKKESRPTKEAAAARSRRAALDDEPDDEIEMASSTRTSASKRSAGGELKRVNEADVRKSSRTTAQKQDAAFTPTSKEPPPDTVPPSPKRRKATKKSSASEEELSQRSSSDLVPLTKVEVDKPETAALQHPQSTTFCDEIRF